MQQRKQVDPYQDYMRNCLDSSDGLPTMAGAEAMDTDEDIDSDVEIYEDPDYDAASVNMTDADGNDANSAAAEPEDAEMSDSSEDDVDSPDAGQTDDASNQASNVGELVKDQMSDKRNLHDPQYRATWNTKIVFTGSAPSIGAPYPRFRNDLQSFPSPTPKTLYHISDNLCQTPLVEGFGIFAGACPPPPGSQPMRFDQRITTKVLGDHLRWYKPRSSPLISLCELDFALKEAGRRSMQKRVGFRGHAKKERTHVEIVAIDMEILEGLGAFVFSASDVETGLMRLKGTTDDVRFWNREEWFVLDMIPQAAIVNRYSPFGHKWPVMPGMPYDGTIEYLDYPGTGP